VCVCACVVSQHKFRSQEDEEEVDLNDFIDEACVDALARRNNLHTFHSPLLSRRGLRAVLKKNRSLIWCEGFSSPKPRLLKSNRVSHTRASFFAFVIL
jgi:hypothetical protein